MQGEIGTIYALTININTLKVKYLIKVFLTLPYVYCKICFPKRKKMRMDRARLNSRKILQNLIIGEYMEKKCPFSPENEEKHQILSTCQDSIPHS